MFADTRRSHDATTRSATSSPPAPLRLRLHLAGEAVDTDERLEVRSPWDGSLVGTVPMAGRPHIDLALERARHYARDPLPEAARAALLERWADAIEAAAAPLARLLVRENGKPLGNASVEIGRAAATARRYAEAALALNAPAHAALASLDAPIAPDRLDAERLIVPTLYRPLGVVTAFTPFNFPANTVVHKIAAAIAAGNAVLVKPSEKTPLVALELARLFAEAGGPDDALSVLTGHYSAFVEPFVEDPAVDFFTMTGHSAVGRELYRRFTHAQPFKGCHFELGGNAPQLCLADIAPERAAALLATAVFDHNGSRCTTPRKILVPAGGWRERFLEAAAREARRWPAGDPLEAATRIGPLIDEAAARTVAERVEEALAMGARLIAGGRRRGAVYEATVVAGVHEDMRLFREENFGPVMSVIGYDDVDEAVRLGNLGEYGLQPAVLTADLRRGATLAARLRGGCLNVGHTATSFRSDTTPFGGVAASGIGKEGGVAGVREMCVEVPLKLHPAEHHPLPEPAIGSAVGPVPDVAIAPPPVTPYAQGADKPFAAVRARAAGAAEPA